MSLFCSKPFNGSPSHTPSPSGHNPDSLPSDTPHDLPLLSGWPPLLPLLPALVLLWTCWLPCCPQPGKALFSSGLFHLFPLPGGLLSWIAYDSPSHFIQVSAPPSPPQRGFPRLPGTIILSCLIFLLSPQHPGILNVSPPARKLPEIKDFSTVFTAVSPLLEECPAPWHAPWVLLDQEGS